MNITQAYALVQEVASPTASEGLKKERSILLLWFLRNVKGIDDIEAYEYICDDDDDRGIDALYIERGAADEPETLNVYQSKYPTTAKNVGETDLREFVGAAQPLLTADGLGELLQSKTSADLRKLLQRLNVQKRLKDGKLRVRLTFVTAGQLQTEARAYAKAANESNKDDKFLVCYDAIDLAPIITAFKSPSTLKATIRLDCKLTERFEYPSSSGRVAVCAIKASDVVKWPGIDDRTLFDLNVRRELRGNDVRRQLDKAILRQADHENFIAFHNGITVVCDRLDLSDPNVLTAENISVVNGAQSTIAFRASEKSLTDKLRVVAKFVEINPSQQLAREVAIRSNTQNPVTTRNLRANDGVQLRIAQEFKKYPAYHYETRPDRTLKPDDTKVVIQNDEVGQLLCAIVNERPWKAIWRLSLFDAETYPAIFNDRTTASHVLLCHLIAEAVQSKKDLFPTTYQRSWQLTRLVAVYLIGQMLRVEYHRHVIDNPAEAMTDTATTQQLLDKLARFAATTLKIRRDRAESGADDFKVEFKREEVLRTLARQARENYITHVTMSVSEDDGPPEDRSKARPPTRRRATAKATVKDRRSPKAQAKKVLTKSTSKRSVPRPLPKKQVAKKRAKKNVRQRGK